MDDTTPDLSKLVDEVQQQRDELRVQLHLAKAEAKEEWEHLEVKWDALRGKAGVVGREAGKAAREVAAALHLAAEELKRGYERIRQLL